MKAFKYYLNIPSGRQLADEIRALRREAGLPPGKAPHVTIVPPYRGNSQLHPGSEEEIMLKLSLCAIIGQLQQPTIESLGFEVFDDGKILIVAIRKTPELQACFDRCLAKLRPHINNLDLDSVRTDYNPHITIAKDLEPGDGQELLARLRSSGAGLPETFVAPGINLLRRSATDPRWTILETFEFAPE